MQQQRICTADGCERPHLARGLCKAHYARWSRQQPHIKEQTKGYEAERRTDPARREQERLRNAKPARLAYQRAWQDARTDWGEWWQRQRAQEDRREIRHWKPRVGPHCKLTDRPKPRHFLGWFCRGCGEAFVYYAKRAQSPYCAECNEARQRGSASRRARRSGVVYEVVVPRRVFERDGYRCQICRRKTRGVFPALLSPTLDHIIPLSEGGSHTYDNLQCACFRCNSVVKGAGAANDQLRLVV